MTKHIYKNAFYHRFYRLGCLFFIMKNPLVIVLILLGMGLISFSCTQEYPRSEINSPLPIAELGPEQKLSTALFTHVLQEDVSIARYFSWIKSLAIQYDTLVPYYLSPQLLVHANPWVIDSFVHSDYYHLMDQGTFVYDQKSWVVLKAGDTLLIPSKRTALELEAHLQSIHIDVNLPEYTLRLMHGNNTLYAFPVRIGQHGQKYLNTEGRVMDLHTVIGTGKIIDIIHAPKYINFNTGATYTQTRGDDEKTTLMPLIPTLEPEINGICHGQLIHPTTNPNTLGKAYSHGCIGTREGDAWRIYFYARLGMPIRIRYDLNIINENGDTLVLPDVYELHK